MINIRITIENDDINSLSKQVTILQSTVREFEDSCMLGLKYVIDSWMDKYLPIMIKDLYEDQVSRNK